MAVFAIEVIGLGTADRAQLSESALLALQSCSVVIGWARHKEVIAPYLKTSIHASINSSSGSCSFCEVKTLNDLETALDQLQQSSQNGSQLRVAVVASGDPLHFGIGRWLTQKYSSSLLCFHPAVSSIQLACHRQSLSLQDVTVVSLHGRPVEQLRTQLKKNTILVILTDQQSHPQRLAQECLQAGFEASEITVHETLGYPQEKSTTYKAGDLARTEEQYDVDPLHVSVIQVKGEGGVYPEFPGIPDSSYQTGKSAGQGMITKREVRLAIVSLLQPSNEDIIWDIGAGCGGVSIELSYWNAKTQVYAVECHAERLVHLHANRLHFGVISNLHIIEGRAPQVLSELPAPTKVFIGGSDGELAHLLNTAWQQLPLNGVIVATAVMEKSKQILQRFASSIVTADVAVTEISVKRATIKESGMQYQAKLPVEIFQFIKRDDST